MPSDVSTNLSDEKGHKKKQQNIFKFLKPGKGSNSEKTSKHDHINDAKINENISLKEGDKGKSEGKTFSSDVKQPTHSKDKLSINDSKDGSESHHQQKEQKKKSSPSKTVDDQVNTKKKDKKQKNDMEISAQKKENERNTTKYIEKTSKERKRSDASNNETKNLQEDSQRTDETKLSKHGDESCKKSKERKRSDDAMDETLKTKQEIMDTAVASPQDSKCLQEPLLETETSMDVDSDNTEAFSSNTGETKSTSFAVLTEKETSQNTDNTMMIPEKTETMDVDAQDSGEVATNNVKSDSHHSSKRTETLV